MAFRNGVFAWSARAAWFLWASLSLVAFGAAADRVPVWLPTSVDIDVLSDWADLYYNGLTGRLVGVGAEALPGVEAMGGVRIGIDDAEALYVFLVEDAARADFEPPSRVLLRSGHELLVATPGEAPRLTAAARTQLTGLQQPVLIPRTPIVWPETETPQRGGMREVDPLIQQMVDALTTANYMVTWEALEDFVTRYTYAPQNELATQWILDQFLSFGLDAEFHYYNQSGQKRNVIATLPGVVDPTQVVYITAHLDATSDTPNSCAPGADDNGSGTAAVIEAARVLSQFLFQYTVKFACFNGEEQGLVGSGAYVNDIALAGEDVIGAFNMDMIAYRGTDPAPPDMIIYTNSGSQHLALTLEDAANTYTPGLLDPIVLVESISASDHASFWAHGYDAILAIEEEAWGSDFCPWYHTCEDLVYRYPQDYVLHCARANLAAVATTALPVNPEGPYVVLTGTEPDDDASGASNGDGDGLLNPGETIELTVTLRNVGTDAATNVSGELASESGSVTIVSSTSSWSDIPAGGEAACLSSFVFEIAGTALDGEALAFTLTVTHDSGSQDLSMQFNVVAPRLAYYFHRLDDAATGNHNGVLDPGEVVRLPVSLANSGGKNAADVQAILSSGSAYVTVLDDEAGTESVPMNDHAELSPAYRVQIAGDAPIGERLELDLAITAGSGYLAESGFTLKVGTHFFDDAQADGAWSLGVAGDDASTGQWVRVDPNGTTYDGQPCQPEDDHTADPGTDCFVTGQGAPGGSAGSADVDGGTTTLMTPIFDLTSLGEARVTYWRWYTNDLGNNPGEDTWLVQVSADGGNAWVDLERTTASANLWQEKTFLIEEFITPTNAVVFRFVASDLGSGSLVEAAVDDFEISGTLGPVAVEANTTPLVLRLGAAVPSPLRHAARIPLEVPEAGHVALKLYGVDGRLVRTLVDGHLNAGKIAVAWDGRSDAGLRVAPGIYFYRLEASDRQLVRRLVVTR